jgi:hypothetical protein
VRGRGEIHTLTTNTVIRNNQLTIQPIRQTRLHVNKTHFNRWDDVDLVNGSRLLTIIDLTLSNLTVKIVFQDLGLLGQQSYDSIQQTVIRT